jgi:hypothetical protein
VAASEDDLSPEQLTLQSIAKDLSTIAHALYNPAEKAMKEMGLDAETWRQEEREKREREQVKLYRLAVVIACISAFSSIASVVVAAIGA